MRIKTRLGCFFGLLFLVPWTLSGALTQEMESRVLYLVHKGEVAAAFSTYLEGLKTAEGTSAHDFPVLQKAALTLLEQGSQHKEKPVVLLSMMGAGVSLHKGAIPILRRGLRSEDPEVQLTALHFLFRFEEDETLSLLREALSSPHLLIRLEAMLFLAEREDPSIVDHLSSLYGKVPDPVKVLFPQILTLIDTPSSTTFLRKLLSEKEYQIRLSTLLEIAKTGRDDLLPHVRALATHPGLAEQEACAYVLGKLKDREAIALLQKLSQRTHAEVSIAALQALHAMGEPEALPRLLQAAQEKDLFAIALLGELKEGEKSKKVLLPLLESKEPLVRLNAALGLLELREKKGLDYLQNIFRNKKEDLGFCRQRSLGKSLFYWKSTSSYSQKIKTTPLLAEDNRLFLGKILQAALEFPEEEFLPFLKFILDRKEYPEFFPLIMQLLMNHQTPQVLALLQEKSQVTGAPLLRYCANLTLYKMTQDPLYEQPLLEFIQAEKGKELLFTPPKSALTTPPSPHALSPEESTALHVAILETLSAAHGEKILDTLIDAIAYGNPKNRYALAGLLIRMTE